MAWLNFFKRAVYGNILYGDNTSIKRLTDLCQTYEIPRGECNKFANHIRESLHPFLLDMNVVYENNAVLVHANATLKCTKKNDSVYAKLILSASRIPVIINNKNTSIPLPKIVSDTHHITIANKHKHSDFYITTLNQIFPHTINKISFYIYPRINLNGTFSYRIKANSANLLDALILTDKRMPHLALQRFKKS